LTDFRTFDSEALAPQEIYPLLVHAVSPRPIALTSTLSETGEPNLAPFSFFMAGGVNPVSVVISVSNTRTGATKDTLRNIKATGEYVINIVTFGMKENMNQTSVSYLPGESEWEHTSFTPGPCLKVKPKRVLQSPISMECRLFHVIEHGSNPLSANYVIGEVVCVHVAIELFSENGKIDPERVDYIARMGGDWYSRVTPASMFEMERP